MIIVSNSGPIISFARAGHLELLKQVLQEIRIPEAVYEDIVIKGKRKPGAPEVEAQEWIRKERIKDRSKIDQLLARLGLGEKEAIVLAKELGAILLIDDLSARKEAEKIEVVCIGSLRILKEAKDRRLIKEIKPIGDDLRKAGIRIKNSLYQKFLQEMGE